MPGLTFDEQSVRRIVRSVLYTERRDRSRQVRGKRSRQVSNSTGFDRIKARSVGPFTAGTSAIFVDNVIPTKGPSPLDTPGDATEQLVVSNDLGLSGGDNELVYAEYHVNDSAWHLYEPPGESTTTSQIAKTSPGTPIAARSGMTLSSQSCEIFRIDASTLVTTSTFQTVYNIGDTEIPEDFFVEASQDQNSGLWFAEAPGDGGGAAVIFKTSPGTPIAARSGTTVSSESCQIFMITDTTLVDTETTKFIQNLSNIEIPEDHYGVAVQEENSNLWVATSEVGSVIEIARTGTGGIPGRTGSAEDGVTPGKATVDLWEINDDDEGVDASVSATVYNWAAQDVPANWWIMVAKERNGKRVAIWEECWAS